jgi:hypothetical protein
MHLCTHSQHCAMNPATTRPAGSPSRRMIAPSTRADRHAHPKRSLKRPILLIGIEMPRMPLNAAHLVFAPKRRRFALSSPGPTVVAQRSPPSDLPSRRCALPQRNRRYATAGRTSCAPFIVPVRSCDAARAVRGAMQHANEQHCADRLCLRRSSKGALESSAQADRPALRPHGATFHRPGSWVYKHLCVHRVCDTCAARVQDEALQWASPDRLRHERLDGTRRPI